jgi:hypothetical protein
MHLARRSEFEAAAEAVRGAKPGDTIVLAAPLYTDAMPGLAKSFIEELSPAVGKLGGVRLGFIIHSGFSEALHSRHLERYYERLAERLGAEYAGTIVKGGSEGLRLMPRSWNRKLWEKLEGLGISLEHDGRFDEALLRDVAGYEQLGPGRRVFYEVFGRTPLARSYWNGMLKKNGAWEERWAAPYGEAARS